MKRARRSTAHYGDSEPKTKAARKEDAGGQPEPGPGCSGVAAAATTPDAVDSVCFLDSLPDHLVVRIFKFLDLPETAFLVPQVCKRWSSLATSEDVWKDLHLSYEPYMSDSKKALFFKCMKMAPKVGALTAELEWRDGNAFNLNVKANSPREITALHFIYDNMPPEAMFTLLRKYKNCIEKLAITDTYTPYVDGDVRRLWNHIQNLSRLKHLVVDGAALFYCKATFRKNSPCWKTLHILDVQDCSYEDMNTVQRLIASNQNWTEVYLATPDSKLFRGEVKALAKCLKLDSVQVPFCKEIKLLEKCDSLDSLIIDCVEETAKEIVGVITLLSKSTVFPNLKAIKMVGGGSEYTKLLICLLKGRPGINLLSLVSMDLSAKDMTAILPCAPGVECLFLNEMSGHCVSVVNNLNLKLLPNLKKVGFVECHCIKEDSMCVKQAEIQLKNQRPSLEIISQCSCNCKPPNYVLDDNPEKGEPKKNVEEKEEPKMMIEEKEEPKMVIKEKEEPKMKREERETCEKENNNLPEGKKEEDKVSVEGNQDTAGGSVSEGVTDSMVSTNEQVQENGEKKFE